VSPQTTERRGREGSSPSARARLRAPALALLSLVLTGVLAAVVLKPFLTPSAHVDRTAERAPAEREVVALDRLAREPRAAPREQPADAPAEAATVIGVGTGEFRGSTPAAVEDPDGPPSASELHAPSDAEVRRDLAAFRDYLEGVDPRKGGRAHIDKRGRLVLPKGAPRRVALVVAAANEIATKPYKWGGGHGAWKDSGYDCSGSVSYALAGARLLNRPLDSSGFMRYGSRGSGSWISVYSNPGHMFMTVAGFRFDTSGQSAAGTRWQRGTRSTAGFTVRHPPGL
jgi:cell wall-associated NlpC family hydrolase